MKKFNKLSFDKKTIAKLNDEQLSSVKGGNNGNSGVGLDLGGDKNKCKTTSTTKVCSTTSTTNVI